MRALRPDSPRKARIFGIFAPWSALLVAGLLALSGCGADTVQGFVAYPDGTAWGDGGTVVGFDAGGAQDSAEANADGQLSGSDATANSDAKTSPYQLKFAMPNGNKDDFGGVCDKVCAIQIHQNGLRNLHAQLLKNGQPVPNDEIRFQLAKPGDKALGEVLVEGALTDEKGKGASQVKSNNQLGTFDVVVSAPGHEDCEPIAFQIHVISKVKGPLTLTMAYKGINNPTVFTHNKFRLSLQEKGFPKCADIDLGTWDFTAGWNRVALSRWTTPGYVVIADAVRVKSAE